MLRVTRAIAVLAVLATALSACGSGPNQVGAAAIVGDHAISVDHVQQLLENALRDEPAADQLAKQRKLDLATRKIVGQLVVHELVNEAARREGLSVDERDVAELHARLDQPAEPLPEDGSAPPEALVERTVIAALDRREYARDLLLQQMLAVKYLNTMSVTFDYTTVTSENPADKPESMRDAALEKAKQFAQGPDKAAEVIAKDQEQGGRGNVGETVPAVQAPDFIGTVMFGAPENTVVAFQPDPGQALWFVMLIRERNLNASASEPGSQQANASQQTLFGRRLLQPLVGELGVRVSPRYGVWDAAAMDVAPSESETAGVILPASTKTP